MLPGLRTVKTPSCATTVQIMYSSHRGSRDIEHIGSAHDEVQLEVPKAAGGQLGLAGRLCRPYALLVSARPPGLWPCPCLPFPAAGDCTGPVRGPRRHRG